VQASYAALALVGGFFAYKAFKGESLDNAAGDLKVRLASTRNHTGNLCFSVDPN
jgi:hypothetical protein